MARRLGQVVAALLLLLLQGCLTVEQADDEVVDSSEPEAAGAPLGNGGEGEAPGAPIDIPAITVAQGQPADVVRAQLEEKLREACGGQVCVGIVVAQTHPEFQTCQYSGETDPPAGTRVERGSTLTVIMGSQPCTEGHDDGVESGTPDEADTDSPDESDTDGEGTADVLDDDAEPSPS